MATLAQTTTGDLDLSSGNLQVISDLATETATKLNCLFGFWKREWFLDQSQGVPFLEYVLVKNPNLSVIDSVFREVISFAPGVASVRSSNLALDTTARKLTATYKLQLTNGTVIVGGPGVPFTVVVQK